MALIDAVANSINIPLWRLFGGVSNSITTDITVSLDFSHFILFLCYCESHSICLEILFLIMNCGELI